MTDIEIVFGHENFANYRRLSYKWWYALAEFVDNSTQSYFDHREELDNALNEEKDVFKVVITTDQNFIRIYDNAMGMDVAALQSAMVVGRPPADDTGRCRYGLGMKTSACWIGNDWKITTSKLGSDAEITLDLNVDDVAAGTTVPPVSVRSVPEKEHYTILEVSNHNRPLRGRTIGKVKEYLGSIYRQDLTNGDLQLTYNDERLVWEELDDSLFLKRKDGSLYKEDIAFEIESGKVVIGWVGVLQKGARAKAGFSIFHRSRLIKGWPESWRPEKIYGHGGRNDLINQRLVGEVNLEDFEVSHTKDEINWDGDEEEQVEELLRDACKDLMKIAKEMRKGQAAPGHGPEAVHVAAAVQELEQELSTEAFLETLSLESTLPPVDQIKTSNSAVVDNATSQEPEFSVKVANTHVSVYIDTVGSPNDPYFINEPKDDETLIVIINALHPHWSMLEGENSVVNYLRHCVYDALAEHRAVRKKRVESDSVKLLKDGYLRVAFDVLQAEPEEADAD